MAPSVHNPPASADEWVIIAKRELSNLKGAYEAQQSNDAKVDHALMATEAILKAIIWKQHKWPKWPAKMKGTKYLFNHSLDAMLDASCLRQRLRLDEELWLSWNVLTNAVQKQHRYSPTVPSDEEANEVARATRHPDFGVVPWLLERYQEIK
ncbi:MAG: hypothetical protein ACFCUT_06760 [Kiloniellaceae bacterium]